MEEGARDDKNGGTKSNVKIEGILHIEERQ